MNGNDIQELRYLLFPAGKADGTIVELRRDLELSEGEELVDFLDSNMDGHWCLCARGVGPDFQPVFMPYWITRDQYEWRDERVEAVDMMVIMAATPLPKYELYGYFEARRDAVKFATKWGRV